MTTLQTHYNKNVVPMLTKELSIDNAFSVPKLQKIIVNIGVTDPQEPKARRTALENISEQFMSITGQKPVITLARQSISTFKLRKGDPLGVMVTLRGKRMWQFLEKLISIALPRVKDFQGVSNVAFDGNGNYSMGIKEQIIFPEISYDSIERIRSFQVVFVTSAKDNTSAFKLLEQLGIPFAKAEIKG